MLHLVFTVGTNLGTTFLAWKGQTNCHCTKTIDWLIRIVTYYQFIRIGLYAPKIGVWILMGDQHKLNKRQIHLEMVHSGMGCNLAENDRVPVYNPKCTSFYSLVPARGNTYIFTCFISCNALQYSFFFWFKRLFLIYWKTRNLIFLLPNTNINYFFYT